jgi:hypothetical protein
MDGRTRGARAALVALACVIVAALLPGAAFAATGRSRPATTSGSQSTCPWLNDSESIETRVSQLMSRMTLSDEIDLVEGHGSGHPVGDTVRRTSARSSTRRRGWGPT